MDNCISILPNVTLWATLAATFAILFAIVLMIFRRVAFFEGKTAVMIAVCVCIIGLSQFVAAPGGAHDVAGTNREISVPVSHLLLPHFALAVAAAVVLSQVLLLASRIPSSEEAPAGNRETVAGESECLLAKPKSPGRPKKEKDKPAEKESKEATKPVGSTS